MQKRGTDTEAVLEVNFARATGSAQRPRGWMSAFGASPLSEEEWVSYINLGQKRGTKSDRKLVV